MESSLEPQPPQPTRWQRFKRLFVRRYRAECGHETYLKNTLPRFPEYGIITLKRQDDRKIHLCHDCLDAGSIRCAWCSNPILYGEPITLYTPKKDDAIPPHAIRYAEDPIQLVGCLGWECADTGADRAGFWIPPGRVHRVPTVFEQMMAHPGRVILINDLSDPEEAIHS